MTAAARQTRRAALAAVALGLAAAACGARLPGGVQQQAVRAVLDPESAVVSTTAPGESGSAVAPVGPGGGSVPSTGPIPSNPAAAGSPPAGRGAGQSKSAASASPTTTSAADCSGGTDVGLTASELTLGSVVTLSGPVSGLFQGAEQGGEA